MERIKLKSRDLEILKALEKWGVLGLGQCEGLLFWRGIEMEKRVDRFFNKADRRIYNRYGGERLLRLREAGLIRTLRFMNHPQFYCLSESGHEVLKQRGVASQVGFTRVISEDFLRHEMSVNAVGMVLQELFDLRVTTERERVEVKRLARLPHHNRLILSDLWVVNGPRPRAIEVERSKKSAAAYRKIWEAYKERMLEQFPEGVVLYLTMDAPGLKKQLSAYAREWEMDFIYFAELKDFRSSMGRCQFAGFYEDDGFSFSNGRGGVLHK
ncbi:MAG: hypothetical protein ABIJ96_15080 [Elusimicrobiota bacterium]